jgi:heme/copper-type cytochrome/quinol oxidase subunit 4
MYMEPKSNSDVSPWAVVAALAIICATVVAVVWLIVNG